MYNKGRLCTDCANAGRNTLKFSSDNYVLCNTCGENVAKQCAVVCNKYAAKNMRMEAGDVVHQTRSTREGAA